MSASRERINIDIVSDFACPWCLLGKKKLDVAMKELECRFDFNVRWKPFLLRPDIPQEGGPPMQLTSGLEQKIKHVQDACKAVGLDLKTRNPIRMPYTLQAHMLLEFVENHLGIQKQNEIAENLFQAYFVEGKDYQMSLLLEEASKAGIDIAEVKAYLENPEATKEVKSKALTWSQQGITGVPYFFFNGRPAFSGAQEPLVFKQTILKVAEKFPLDTRTDHSPNL